MSSESKAKAKESGKFLDSIERIGNKVPNPTIMFVYLIGFVALLSAVLSWMAVSVTDEVVTPVPSAALEKLNSALGGTIMPFDTATESFIDLPDFTVSEQTFPVRNLLSGDGLQFFFSSFVDNFAGFSVVAVTLVAMAGVGVAEHAGMMGALIRKIVKVAPRWSLAFILIFVGVLSSVASDAGYLILIPLAAAAFLSVGRHPLAGMAAAFAGVGAIFSVNLLITPVDSMLTEITNEALGNIGLAPLDRDSQLLLQHRLLDPDDAGCRLRDRAHRRTAAWKVRDGRGRRRNNRRGCRRRRARHAACVSRSGA